MYMCTCSVQCMHDTGRQPLNIADADGYNSVMLIVVSACTNKSTSKNIEVSFKQFFFFENFYIEWVR